MSTYMAKPQEIERKWYIVDATDKTLGRLASEVAKVLRGKHKTIYTPNVDVGDFVIITNAEKVAVTGNKAQQKMYYRHSRHPGGLKGTVFSSLLKTKPEKIIEFAVKGMLPHTKLGTQMLKKLKVYRGEEHPHQAQKPEVLDVQG